MLLVTGSKLVNWSDDEDVESSVDLEDDSEGDNEEDSVDLEDENEESQQYFSS